MSAEKPPHHTITPPVALLLGREILRTDADGTIHVRFLAKPEFANRHGSVQGGLVAAMLDSATSAVLILKLPPELTSVTARLETDFLKPAPIAELFAKAWIVSRDERSAVTRGELSDADGTIVAQATAHLRVRKRT
ncbi:MAG TPA: PaaI family thioesterase [Rhizomicrobium sp.]|nr:PaaI family thioesterase [Rhizomicrobium sp.]